MNEPTWMSIAVYPDRASAEAALGLLAADDLPAYISSDAYVPGLGTNFSVLVPSDLLPRARWILRESALSEEELTELATASNTGNAEG